MNVRDSKALNGFAPTVAVGGSIELQADSVPDSVGLAGTYNLYFAGGLNLTGGGFNGEGAIDNISGVNKVEGAVSLSAAGATIGVDPDPDPFDFGQAPWNDLSQLTIDGVISGGVLTKTGYGELVLTAANTFSVPAGANQYQAVINQGWITVENAQALGAIVPNIDPSNQPGVNVADVPASPPNPLLNGSNIGAAVVLKEDLLGHALSLPYAVSLTGLGITSRFPWLNQMGAVVSLDGLNTISGDVYLNNATPATGIITSASAASPIVITTPSTAALVNGETVTIAGVTGNTAANSEFTITLLTATTFSLNSSTGGTLVGTGGTWTTVGLDGIGVEIDGAVSPYPNPSQLILTGTIHNAVGVVGELVKVGTERLIIQGTGLYTGGVDIQSGVILIENDTALGQGTAGASITTTVETGAALELGSTIPQNTGGIERGLEIWYTNLDLSGPGNAEFGDAPLMIGANDNIWHGPITLNAAITVTFQGAAGNMAVPTMTVGMVTNPLDSLIPVNSTVGGPNVNAVQTLNFSGFTAGDKFTLVVNNNSGGAAVQTPVISWSANVNQLMANIQTALSSLTIDNLFNVGVSVAQVALLSPAIDVFPNARFTVTGSIGNGAIPADISVNGGGELNLAGANTFTGTMYVNQGILTLENSQALGTVITPQVQTITLNGAALNTTSFNLSFNGYTTSTPIPYTGTDTANILAALNALPSIGGVGGSVTVNENATNPVDPIITITFGGALNGFAETQVTATITHGPALTPANLVVTNGQGGTVVASGSQLQLEGTVNIVGEPLMLQGSGNPLETEIQQVNVSGATNGTFQMTFNNPFFAAKITAAAWNANLATITAANTFSAGQTVVISGVSPVGYNGTFTIASASATSFSYALATPLTSGPSTGAASSSSTTLPLPVGASAAQVQAALNALPSIQAGVGAGAGTVSVSESAFDVYTVLFSGSFTGASQPWSEQAISVNGTTDGQMFTLNFTGYSPTTTVAYDTNPATQATNIENAITTLLANPTSPGGGNGTVTGVTYNINTNTYVATFGGALADASVPLLIATDGPQNPLLASQVGPQQELTLTGVSGDTYTVQFDPATFPAAAPAVTVNVGATPAATQANLQFALNSLLTQFAASPGNNAESANVTVDANGNFVITFSGPLGTVVPDLLAVPVTATSASIGAVATATVANPIWLTVGTSTQVLTVPTPSGTSELNYTGYTPTVSVPSNVTASQLQTDLNTLLTQAANSPGGGAAVKTFIPSTQGLLAPAAEAFDSSGNLYIANSAANTISKVTFSSPGVLGTVTTFVPLGAGLNVPTGLAFDSSGNLYVANLGNNTISQVTFSAPGVLNAVINNFVPAAAGLNSPIELAFDSSGNLYVTNQVSNTISQVTFSAPGVLNAVNTFVAAAAGLNDPTGLAFDSSGNLYVASLGNNTISKITFTAPGVLGAVTNSFVPAAAGLNQPFGLTFDSNGNLYVVNFSSDTISEATFSAPGVLGAVTTFLPTSAGLNGPFGLAFDSSGNLYVANLNSNTISEVVPAGTSITGTATVTTQAAQAVAVIGTVGDSFTLNFTGFARSATVVLGETTQITQASIQFALDEVLYDSTHTAGLTPGLGNGTALVAYNPLTQAYDITFSGSLANVNVPLLNITAATGNAAVTVPSGAFDIIYGGSLTGAVVPLLTSLPQQTVVVNVGNGSTFQLSLPGVVTTPIVTVGSNQAVTNARLQVAFAALYADPLAPGLGAYVPTVTADPLVVNEYIVSFTNVPANARSHHGPDRDGARQCHHQ